MANQASAPFRLSFFPDGVSNLLTVNLFNAPFVTLAGAPFGGHLAVPTSVSVNAWQDIYGPGGGSTYIAVTATADPQGNVVFTFASTPTAGPSLGADLVGIFFFA